MTIHAQALGWAKPGGEPRLITPADLATLDAEIRAVMPQVRDAQYWLARDAELRTVRNVLPEFLGRTVTDIERALQQAEADAAEAEAEAIRLRERKRDIEGYIRVLEERQQTEPGQGDTALLSKRKED